MMKKILAILSGLLISGAQISFSTNSFLNTYATKAIYPHLDVPPIIAEQKFYNVAASINSILKFHGKNDFEQEDIYRDLRKITNMPKDVAGIKIKKDVATYITQKSGGRYVFNDLGALFGRKADDLKYFSDYVQKNLRQGQPVLLSYLQDGSVSQTFLIFDMEISDIPEYTIYHFLDPLSGKKMEFMAESLDWFARLGSVIGIGNIFPDTEPPRNGGGKIEVEPVSEDELDLDSPKVGDNDEDWEDKSKEKDREVVGLWFDLTDLFGLFSLGAFSSLFGFISFAGFFSWISSVSGPGWTTNGLKIKTDDFPDENEWESEKEDQERRKEKEACKKIETWVKRQVIAELKNTQDDEHLILGFKWFVGSKISDDYNQNRDISEQEEVELKGRVKIDTGKEVEFIKR